MFISICNHTFLDAFLIPGKGHISTACWHKSHRQLQKRWDNKYALTYIHTHIRRKTWHPPTLSRVDCHMVPINFCQSQQASQPLADADKAISTAEGLLCFPPPTRSISVGFFFFFKVICSWETLPSPRHCHLPGCSLTRVPLSASEGQQVPLHPVGTWGLKAKRSSEHAISTISSIPRGE